MKKLISDDTRSLFMSVYAKNSKVNTVGKICLFPIMLGATVVFGLLDFLFTKEK